MRTISKSEIKYISLAGVFAFLFFVVILPNFSSLFEGLNPYIQFLLFNISIFIFLQIFLKSIVIGKKIKFIYGLGLTLLFLGIDLMIPPLSIGFDGKFASGLTLIQSSSDYVVGLLWNSIGISGFILFIFVYAISPLILFIMSALLLRDFVKEV